jgi:glutamate racemase
LNRPRQRIDTDPIGVFDSGMGGLSIVQEIRRELPNEQIVYLADTKHVPYGDRSDEEIRQLTAQAVDWLYAQGCKLVVVACNTASAFSLTPLREYYGEALPIVGLVPAVKPAVLATRSKKIGVLATTGTLRGTLLQDVIREVAVPAQVEVFTAVSPKLVPFVEAGEQNSSACQAELLQVLTPLAEQGVDQLVLGCTHYPFLADAIRRLFADQFCLVDSGAAVAKQTCRLLEQHQLRSMSHLSIANSALDCFVTGDVEQAQPVMQALIKESFTIHHVGKSSADQQQIG